MKTRKIIKEEKISKIPKDMQRHQVNYDKGQVRINKVKKMNPKKNH